MVPLPLYKIINVIAHEVEISNRYWLSYSWCYCKRISEFSGWKLLCLYKKNTLVFCQNGYE